MSQEGDFGVGCFEEMKSSPQRLKGIRMQGAMGTKELQLRDGPFPRKGRDLKNSPTRSSSRTAESAAS